MSYSQLFEHDQQFMRLVRRETDVDLVTAALEIARDGQTDLLFEPTRVCLQRAVARLTHPVTQAGSDVEELKLLVRYMTEELNLRGDDDCFAEPDASYLNRVLETGRGIPISLSLIYLNVANELGRTVEICMSMRSTMAESWMRPNALHGCTKSQNFLSQKFVGHSSRRTNAPS